MKKTQKLGQHFLKSQSLAKSIVSAANLTKSDVVLEIGTGTGILVPHLCEKAGKVISIEYDKELYMNALSEFSHLDNLTIKHGDGFQSKVHFTVFVSNLPYSKSRQAMEWLVQKKFSHAIVMVQKEFTEKLQATMGKDRKSISVIVNHCFDIEQLMKVKKTNFIPIPKVDSVVLKLTQKKIMNEKLVKTINKLFSYRRKTIQNISKQFGYEIKSDMRLDDLDGEEIIKIAKKFIKK